MESAARSRVPVTCEGMRAGRRVSASTQPMRIVPSQSIAGAGVGLVSIACACEQHALGDYQRRRADLRSSAVTRSSSSRRAGPVVLELRFADDEDAARLFAQLPLRDAERAQPFGAGALHELQVVGVEHDAAGIGVFPVDAHRAGRKLMRMRRRLPSRAAARPLLRGGPWSWRWRSARSWPVSA